MIKGIIESSCKILIQMKKYINTFLLVFILNCCSSTKPTWGHCLKVQYQSPKSNYLVTKSYYTTFEQGMKNGINKKPHKCGVFCLSKKLNLRFF